MAKCRQGLNILYEFIRKWKESFKPPPPYSSKSKKKWNWEWSCYMSKWLWGNYECWFEYPVNPEVNRHKLDAAIWLNKKDRHGSMDLALEWEWDHNKVLKKFPYGDFVKVMLVPAKAGLAIIHTRTGRNQTDKAELTLEEIKKSCNRKRPKNDRPVGVIEIHRTFKKDNKCEFKCFFHNIADGSKPVEIKSLNYSW